MKNNFQMLKRSLGAAAAAGVLATQQAYAAGPDYSTMTTGIDWATAITGALALGALLLALYGAIKGAKILIGMVRS